MMRKKPMSSGRRVCAADALATTMKDDQISTVSTAQVSPRALGESFMRGMINPSQYQSLGGLEIETDVQRSYVLFERHTRQAGLVVIRFALCPLGLNKILTIDIVLDANAVADTA